MVRKLINGIFLVWIILILSGCSSSSSPDTLTSASSKRYRTNEIQDYQGTNLDPSIGPRDNSIKGIQDVDIESYRLSITGLVVTPQELTYDQVLELDAYERLITLHCVEGWEATILWKGVLLEDVMDLAGIQASANTVIFHSVDGYTTSLPLEQILSRQLIMAYGSNGLELPAEMGYPFIIVAEDKLGYKWARWVSGIELSDDPEYRGYWESNGYSNDANIK
ncbi:molybdopterin-dependent oxidoreductase [Eubacteriaceae bacterium ES2]|nr:molybdopterin-dependent oxidoreductase [Eubacteriaceae bacterium ES2]